MLVNFSVQNFRSIKDKITLSFEATKSKDLEDYYIIEPREGVRLLKLGMIYGANASGKTNILSALDFLGRFILNPKEKKTEIIDIKPFAYDYSKNSVFNIEFYYDTIKYLYELELNDEYVVSELLYNFTPNKSLVYKRNTDSKKKITNIEFGNKLTIKKTHKESLEANTLWNNTVLGGYLKTNIESKELQDVIYWCNVVLSPMIKHDSDLSEFVFDGLYSDDLSKDTILKVLRKADFNILDIHVDKKEYEITDELLNYMKGSLSNSRFDEIKDKEKVETNQVYFEHDMGGGEKLQIPLYDESVGTQRYYEFGGVLDRLIRKNRIFCIDELESSLHPDLLKHFLLSFLVNSKQSQLIVTTHLRELLMEQDIFRKDAIWFTEKKEDGSTDLYSLDDFDTSVIRKSSSIYNAYKAGKLGATPNLSDYYLDIDYGEE